MSVKHIRHSERTCVSYFEGKNGCNEYFILTRSKREPFFENSLNNVMRDYNLVLERYGLDENTQIFTRFILSDIQNQKIELEDSELFKFCKKGGYSIIGQPPAFEGGGIYLLSYHISGGGFKKSLENNIDGRKHRNSVFLTGDNYNFLFTGAFSGHGKLDSYIQTDEVFDSYEKTLERYDMDLFNNCVRTWIYVRDIDNHYMGMVESRKKLFKKNNMVAETRYIASTGIEAKSLEVSSLVTMDALSIKGIKNEQLVRMEALEHLGPTIDYGVTFERGQAIEFGDRTHHHISGTASIDNTGEVLHLHDVRKQTKRALENIEALLNGQKAKLSDMAYFLIYLRNPSDIAKVEEIIYKYIDIKVPIIFVEGSVCRPTWLVEIEGVAITDADTSYPDFR